jgi:hypothetical protein
MQGVEYAEPNWIYNHFAVSNDTYFTNGSLWACTETQQLHLINLLTRQLLGQTIRCSATVYIGIIDEGYMYTHDLAANAGKIQEK